MYDMAVYKTVVILFKRACGNYSDMYYNFISEKVLKIYTKST